jgi:hypothetical protein
MPAVRLVGAVLLYTSSAMAYTPRPGFMLKELPAAKGSFLLHTWMQAAQTVRANGFSPASEAVGEGAFRMKFLSEALPGLVAQAKILGLCERGSLSFDSLQEPHASMGERLSRTKLVGALSAGKGSAVAFVSEWPDHVCIDACVVNPSYMNLGEEAEAALLEHVAHEVGDLEVRLRPSFQVAGDDFYAGCGFFPMTGAPEEEGEPPMGNSAPRHLLHLRRSDAADAEGGAERDGKAEEEDLRFGAAPAGFEWGIIYGGDD